MSPLPAPDAGERAFVRVLVAEDDSVSAKILQKTLERLGHDVEVVRSGTDAWAACQKHPFPLVLSDWMMPGLEGPELCRLIRTQENGDYSYFIILTAKVQRADKLEALSAGADDFLSKPLDREELHARISVAQRILNMQGRLREQNDQLDDQRSNLEGSDKQLKRQQAELSAALRAVEASSRIAEISRNRFLGLFEGLPVACFACDADGVVSEWNERSVEMFEVNAESAVGEAAVSLLGSALMTDEARAMLSGVLLGREFTDQEWSDGKRFLLVSGLPLHDELGEVSGGIIAAVDVTPQRKAEHQIASQLVELNTAHQQLAKLNSKLSALATTDALTGIPNHRAFQDRLAQLVADAERGRPFALAMVDVDNFKQFNDDFGHQAGDEVLAAVAQSLQGHIRKTDFVARYGGEEFCVLLTDVDELQAADLCEKLRAGVEAINVPYRQVTASFGVCGFDSENQAAADLIHEADEALYAAKQTGRNKVVRTSEGRKKRIA